jgi:hypothetical protein
MFMTRFTVALALAALAAPFAASAQEVEVRPPMTIVGAIVDPGAAPVLNEEDQTVAELAVISETDELPATSRAGADLSEAVETQ